VADRALEIISINEPGELGLEPKVLEVGDKIIEVAGEKAADQLDWHFYTSKSRTVGITVQRKDGSIDHVVLASKAIEGLEIRFKAMDFRRCRCKCPFCFVDQMPKGLRKSLYIKDEDFRLSFLYGNFTTMNDITDDELDKIINQRNSPQWVSVHVVDEEMRRCIFGRPMKRNILDTLRRLAEGGIVIHAQAVLVPGLNDGSYLRETIETLEALHTNIRTLAVVPVGLTGHREGLPELRSYCPDEMERVLDEIEPYRERYSESRRESRFVFPSDEWYLGTRRKVPDVEDYEGFPQLDNGVGMVRYFAEEVEADIGTLGMLDDMSHIRIVTGVLGERVFSEYVYPLLENGGLDSLPELVTVDNVFFGSSVTCSGLLVGKDIVEAFASRETGDGSATVTFIPPNCLNHEDVTIDDMTVGDLSRALGTPVVAPVDPLVRSLLAHAKGRDDVV
jgi:putative radical SAM enzyme (TIGR03279 family)